MQDSFEPYTKTCLNTDEKKNAKKGLHYGTEVVVANTAWHSLHADMQQYEGKSQSDQAVNDPIEKTKSVGLLRRDLFSEKAKQMHAGKQSQWSRCDERVSLPVIIHVRKSGRGGGFDSVNGADLVREPAGHSSGFTSLPDHLMEGEP